MKGRKREILGLGGKMNQLRQRMKPTSLLCALACLVILVWTVGAEGQETYGYYFSGDAVKGQQGPFSFTTSDQQENNPAPAVPVPGSQSSLSSPLNQDNVQSTDEAQSFSNRICPQVVPSCSDKNDADCKRWVENHGTCFEGRTTCCPDNTCRATCEDKDPICQPPTECAKDADCNKCQGAESRVCCPGQDNHGTCKKSCDDGGGDNPDPKDNTPQDTPGNKGPKDRCDSDVYCKNSNLPSECELGDRKCENVDESGLMCVCKGWTPGYCLDHNDCAKWYDNGMSGKCSNIKWYRCHKENPARDDSGICRCEPPASCENKPNGEKCSECQHPSGGSCTEKGGTCSCMLNKCECMFSEA